VESEAGRDRSDEQDTITNHVYFPLSLASVIMLYPLNEIEEEGEIIMVRSNFNEKQ
jgi:hypothetical protein